jgi:chromosomal replication initiator protein
MNKVDRIIHGIETSYNLNEGSIKSRSRTRTVAYARAKAMYWVRKELGFSYTEVGEIFNRDHSTVVHACKKIQEEMDDGDTIRLFSSHINGNHN